MSANKEIIEGHVRSFGWLRRSDLERDGSGQVWERPDGQLQAFMPGTTPKLVKMCGTTFIELMPNAGA